MENVKSGFYWHVHHEVLVEWCFDYAERAEFIRTEKPEKEREIRLRLFQPVKGNLSEEVVVAGQAYNEARQAYNEARQEAYVRAEQALSSLG